jgi:predicted unusual protein kinase regulating ubiquinone biosynthesis (AarF/ABC1/UbiB family)
LHTLRVLIALAPLALSFLRDHRRWFGWGTAVVRTREFHRRRAQRLVARLAALGPTFVKLAQVFSARADLIPEPYLSELGKLTDQVPAVPWPAIEAELVAAYGAPVAEVFERIDPAPVAAASLGQVHRASWRGRDVAVKVLRPGIESLVARDLRVARRIAVLAAKRWPIPHVLGFR